MFFSLFLFIFFFNLCVNRIIFFLFVVKLQEKAAGMFKLLETLVIIQKTRFIRGSTSQKKKNSPFYSLSLFNGNLKTNYQFYVWYYYKDKASERFVTDCSRFNNNNLVLSLILRKEPQTPDKRKSKIFITLHTQIFDQGLETISKK